LTGQYAYKDILVYSPSKKYLEKSEKKETPERIGTVVLTNDLKQCGLTQHTIINTGYLVGKNSKLNEEDIVITTIPNHYSVGLSLGLGLSLSLKPILIFPSDVFNPEKTLSALVSEYCTAIIAFPEELNSLFNSKDYLTKYKSKIKKLKRVIIVLGKFGSITPKFGNLDSLIEKLKI